jgi:sec-independent protein translocase protein TatA
MLTARPNGFSRGKQAHMLGSIGMPELIVIFLIALVIFGPRKLPELGKSLGKSIAEFKRASNELRSTLEEEIRVEEHKSEVAKTAQSTVVPAAPVTAPLASEQSVARTADHHSA